MVRGGWGEARGVGGVEAQGGEAAVRLWAVVWRRWLRAPIECWLSSQCAWRPSFVAAALLAGTPPSGCCPIKAMAAPPDETVMPGMPESEVGTPPAAPSAGASEPVAPAAAPLCIRAA